MDERHFRSDEELELHEYRKAAEELKDARVLEEAEFINESFDEEAESKPSETFEHQDAPVNIIEDKAARRHYWEAQGLIELEQSAFYDALAQGNADAQRNAYFRLAVYHGRTIAILRSALHTRNQPLAQAAMRNLASLHKAMMQMHKRSPHDTPVPLVLDRSERDALVRDLVMRALKETGRPLELDTIWQRVNNMDFTEVAKGTVERHLKDLIASGHVEAIQQKPKQYHPLQRVYREMDTDAPSLHSLLGDEIYPDMEAEGYRGLTDVLSRQVTFREKFNQVTGFDQTSAALFIDLVKSIIEDQVAETSPWRYSDLVGSPYPRPYQNEAYAVFRGYGYHGQLIEAPTGSGKTMIGMMCIQDWLKNLRPGQSILILVPTSNYLQQWTGEMCYKPIGLRLSPEMVFAGTPNQLERFQKRTGGHPAILLMTYTALAQAGSGVGKGGFDIDSIEMFMQGANVQHVIIDEVHKVAENLKSVSSDVIRLMLEWLHDGSLQGLIGFTGTAEAYRSRFNKLGLDLVYSIPIDELIAAGFVAPFAELGAAFAYSEKERQIRSLLDRYKKHTRSFISLIGGKWLRNRFAGIPMDERLSIGHELLNIYKGRNDWQSALPKHLSKWESGGDLQLTEAKIVSIIQIYEGWSDIDLIRAAEGDEGKFLALVDKINAVREKLITLIYLPSTITQLTKPAFTKQFDVGAMRLAVSEATNQPDRNKAVKDGLSTTIVGLYEGLRELYRRMGEGRVETIKAIIEAEKASRPITSTIIFDKARQIDWKSEVPSPGYEGVGGLFAQMLGDERYVPYAILSSAQYLPYDAEDPLPPKISAFVEQAMMKGEIGEAMFALVFQGLEIAPEIQENLYQHWMNLIERYIEKLENVHAARPGEFSRRVLRSMRNRIRKFDLGMPGERLLSRLDLRNIHFADLVSSFFDYAIIARYFRQAKVAQLEQVSGEQQEFYVIPMPGGNRKLLMYDLTSRIVDAETLPINVVIVSSWARTGWNVIKPNLLIDATATRDVTAWQQLRGRAIRAKRTWSNDCYRLIIALIGSQINALSKHDDVPDDVIDVFGRFNQNQSSVILDQNLRQLLAEVTTTDMLNRINSESLSSLSLAERTSIAIELVSHYNKVTHIYELVKAYGSTSQVEYNRQKQVWERRSSIATKHQYETAVNVFTGKKASGDEHAPLLYVEDPRSDLPSELQDFIQSKIEGCDKKIITGWLNIETDSELIS